MDRHLASYAPINSHFSPCLTSANLGWVVMDTALSGVPKTERFNRVLGGVNFKIYLFPCVHIVKPIL